MTNTNVAVQETVAPKMSKMHMGIMLALEAIDNGEYKVDSELGVMHNAKTLKQIGSLDKPSGNIFYVIKGVDILAHRLLYAYYNGGIDALKDGMVIKHLDENKANNAHGNLVQVPRKGAKKALEALRTGKAVEVSVATAEEGTLTEEELTAEVVAETTTYTEKELEARKIMELLIEGFTMKEVIATLSVKQSRVYDVKRGKSNGKATADLREKLEAQLQNA